MREFACPIRRAPAPLSTNAERQLEQGEVVVSVRRAAVGGAELFAAVEIPLAAAQIWPVMTNCDRAPSFVPNLVSCRILERDRDGHWDIRERISSPSWFASKIRTVFRSEYRAPKRVHFARVAGDLRRSDGEWTLTPGNKPGATRVIYQAIVDYETWLPDFVLRDQMEAQMSRTLTALRRECLTEAR